METVYNMAESMESREVTCIQGETLEKARRELGEEPGRREEAIRELREKIEAQEVEEGVGYERKDDKFLLMFLRARKFNMDRSLQLYTNYYRYRQKYAHLLTDYHPKAVENALRSGLIRVVADRSRNGPKIIVISPALWDAQTVPFVDNFKALLLVLDKLIEDENNQIHGFVFINNLKNVGLFTVMSVARTEHVKKGILMELMQEAFPARFKGLHLVHQPWYVSIVLTIVRPFMKQKLRERVHLHGNDFSSLHEYMSVEGLPTSFGGLLPDLEPSCTLALFDKELVT